MKEGGYFTRKKGTQNITKKVTTFMTQGRIKICQWENAEKLVIRKKESIYNKTIRDRQRHQKKTRREKGFA